MADDQRSLSPDDLDDDAYQAAITSEPSTRRRHGAATVALIFLCVLAVFYTLYFLSDLALPIVLAVVLKIILQPIMRLLTMHLHLPPPLAALFLIIGLFGGFAAIGFTLSLPASGWLAKAPESLSALEQKAQILRQPIDMLQRASKQLESIARTNPNEPSAPQPPAAPAVSPPSIGMSVASYLFRGTSSLLSELVILVIVLFFLLGSGDIFLRRLVEILPSLSDKKRAVEIVNEVEHQIAGYLLTITLMNSLVGVATGLAMWACGLTDPILWGVVAFLLNYFPVLGPLTGVVLFFFVGLLSFSSAWYALIPAGIYLLIHIAEGETITPMLLARRFTLNPVLVIVSLFFWHWMWGVPGAFLAVPLLAIAKITFDRIPALMPLGHFMGGDAPEASAT